VRPHRSVLVLSMAIPVAAVFALTAQAGATPAAAGRSAPAQPALRYHRDACGAASAGYARCLATVATAAPGAAAPNAATPVGYAPADLQSAYKLPSSTAGAGRTVAIVDAFDDPNAESDLAQYRSEFGLPACTSAGGCFRKLNQRGGTTPPASDAGWAEEISLDVDMVSAICPNCHILLVEADSNSLANLAAAVDQAAAQGAQAISNSYGGRESRSLQSAESHYNHPGHAITVSSGDSGFGVEFPASSPHVTAVGGTSLSRASSSRGWSESVWSGAGSGCSRVFAKPSWQHDSGCPRRTVADVSAVADPATGVAVYDTFDVSGGPWFRFGGTSVAAPIIASVYALAGNAASVTGANLPYAKPGALFDVIGGSNGSCSPAYLCTGVGGYDGPSGLGTLNGTGAF
jgi:subtilase family serine protease